MTKKPKNVYQFKITLRGSKPPIWRRIQVPEDYSIWDLHVAIQDAMGWEDCHLHGFTIGAQKDFWGIEIGLPEEDDYLESVKEKMKKYFSLESPKALYVYDFGDDWEHSILLEEILPADPEHSYPMCLAGKRACPPEDCGGLYGFYNLLEILADPKHPDHKGIKSWLGRKYDPAAFDPKDVVFMDPRLRRKMAGL